ncbi:MAG: mannose-6-phosphate isomerase, class I [Proteobacteria bacterium]|nr:mannose-6-phosphate isomerase, class I [Pseudomonadota bacterium]
MRRHRPMTILPLRNPIRDYAWGSPTAIPELLGTEATGEPQAELWIGAHPADPSHVEIEGEWQRLDEWIEAQPERALGAPVVSRFGPSLPFLMKVLAASSPLSLQTHPDADQARRGFERENRRGLSLADPARSYADPRPKPELLCALEPFEGLLGFREAADVLAGFERLALASLAEPMAAFASQPDADGLRRFFGALMTLGPEQVASATREAAERAGALSDPRYAWLCELARLYPDDRGVFAPLMLHHLKLQPGEAIYLPPGELHAYLVGSGIEVMANSDNVLRGGLTGKPVDVPGLLEILNFGSGAPEVLRPQETPSGVWRYPTPAAEFELSRLDVAAASPPQVISKGPRLLLCVAGRVELESPSWTAPHALARGESAFIPAATQTCRVSGEGRVFCAGLPLRG